MDEITVTEASEISGYHPDYLRQMIRAGEIQARKFGTVWAIKRESLLEFLRRREAEGEKRGPKPEK